MIIFKGLKKLLGIEGVVVEMQIPREVKARHDNKVNGVLHLIAKGDIKITSIEFKLIERYKKGRKDVKLIHEYLFGSKLRKQNFELNKADKRTLPFDLPF
jgi:phage head maturation protease